MTMPEPESIGPYRLLAPIAEGAMGRVYLAEHEVTKRKLAVKLLRPELFGGERARQRFLLEARAASIEHPNLIQVTDAGEVDGQCFIAMRYVRGLDLGRALAAGPVAPDRAVAILAQIAAALDAAHAQGLIHRDVKPSNILVTSAEDPEGPDHAFLCDFGITKEAEAPALTQTGFAPGTRAYMAPERYRGDAHEGAADQYSLACVAFELLTARRPFPADTEEALMYKHLNEKPPAASSVIPALGKKVDAVLAKGMAKDPASRYASCAAFTDALHLALAGRAPAKAHAKTFSGPRAGADAASEAATEITAITTGGSPPAGRRRRRMMVAVVGVVALVALVGVAATAIVAASRSSNQPVQGAHASTRPASTVPSVLPSASLPTPSPEAAMTVEEAWLRGPYRLVSTYTNWRGLSPSGGNPFWRYWPMIMQPTCAQGPCDATVSFDRFGVHVSGTLHRQGATYTGTLSTRGITTCGGVSQSGSLEVFLRVLSGRLVGPVWRADRTSGWTRYSSASGACTPVTWTATVQGAARH